jgi:hypothetical protein
MSEEKEYHKHKFVVKDGDKAFPIMMCEECEFELDKEYYDGYVAPLERELKEWKVKCAFLESKLSTLLKASEGMEKALNKIHNGITKRTIHGNYALNNIEYIAGEALADFRAVKENPAA